LDKYLVSGKKIKESKYDYDEFKHFAENNKIEIHNDDLFLQAVFYAWSTEGDENGDDAWLYEHLPAKYSDEIYKGDKD
jgi:hypothetical protein